MIYLYFVICALLFLALGYGIGFYMCNSNWTERVNDADYLHYKYHQVKQEGEVDL